MIKYPAVPYLMVFILLWPATLLAKNEQNIVLNIIWDATNGIANSETAQVWKSNFESTPQPTSCSSLTPFFDGLSDIKPSILIELELPAASKLTPLIIFDQDSIAESFSLIHQSKDGCWNIQSSGRLYDFPRRSIISPYANIRLEPSYLSESVYVLAQDSKSIRPWIGAEPEAQFNAKNNLIWSALGAYSGILLVLLLVGLLLVVWQKSLLAALYIFYILVSLFYQFQALGIGPLWISFWPGPEYFRLMQTLSVALVIASIGILIISFLRLKGVLLYSITGGLVLTCSSFFVSYWFPWLYKLGASFIIPLALLTISILIFSMKKGDQAIRWIALGLMASLMGGGVQAVTIISGGAGITGIANFAFAIGNLLESGFWLFALGIRLREDHRKLEAQLYYDATHDSLTGLPNRILFMENLTKCLNNIREQPDTQYALLFIDLDRFKYVNDSLGHHFGDQLLVKAANLLENLTEGGVVGRFGGDEFLILSAEPMSENQAIQFAIKIGNASKEMLQIEGLNLHIKTSSGIVMVNSKYDEVGKIIRDVDIALYKAKQEGGGRCCVYEESMHEATLNRFRIEHELSTAIDNQQFEMYFQPIVDFRTLQTIGFESLVRWNHPVHGLVRPDDFISIAEETGQIVQLGDWIMEECIKKVGIWKLEKIWPDFFYITINISGIQLSDESMIHRIDERLRKHNLDGRDIRIELTETAVISNRQVADEILPRFSDRDIKLCMDDFGTGYSSLTYLNELDFDVLKIDRSFIIDIETRQQSRSLVRTVMAMAKEMNMLVVAEGIETEAQSKILQDMNCDYGQGFLFSKPMCEKDTKIHLTMLSTHQNKLDSLPS